jgi:RNA-binding protein YlmH
MPYKPRPNERKHKSLIADAMAEAELAEQALDELQRAAKNDATKSHIRGIQVRVLRIDKLLSQMMEIARLESDEGL